MVADCSSSPPPPPPPFFSEAADSADSAIGDCIFVCGSVSSFWDFRDCEPLRRASWLPRLPRPFSNDSFAVGVLAWLPPRWP